MTCYKNKKEKLEAALAKKLEKLEENAKLKKTRSFAELSRIPSPCFLKAIR